MTPAAKSPYAGYRFPGEVISMLSWPRPSVGTIWTFLDRVGLTFKKSPLTPRVCQSSAGPELIRRSELRG
jgi:hypothetical protein